MTAVLLDTWVDWVCPNGCPVTDRTRPLPANAARMHTCGKLHTLTAPLVPSGTDCKVTAIERQDYLGREEQRTGDNGRPYMAVQTTHGDGHTDALVFPAVAIARLG